MDSDSNGHQPSSKTTPLLELRGVTCSRDNLPVFQEVNIVVDEGDILVLQGKSGSGKTTLLKCISHLVLYDGLVLYHGSTPKKHGVPTYRSRVLYVPQRPPLLPGTPRDFLSTISTLKSRQSKRTTDTLEHAINISNSWGVDTQLWDREWSNLSGGETQRIALAVAIGLNTAEVLLLDEPTSALDPAASLLVEKFLLDEIHSAENTLKAIIWVTHSDEQGSRVGNRFINISKEGCHEHPLPPV